MPISPLNTFDTDQGLLSTINTTPIGEKEIEETKDTPIEYSNVHHKTKTPYTGIGTDLFVKKNAPGSRVGGGYTIEVFTNGVKTDEIHKKNKDEVKDLIREYKVRYNTDRAFQNEQQLHITYKTKEERGETAMTSLDNILIKKASQIQNMLQRLLDPSTPIKVRQAVEEQVQDPIVEPDPLQQEQMIQEQAGQPTEDQLASSIRDRIPPPSGSKNIPENIKKLFGVSNNTVLKSAEEDVSAPVPPTDSATPNMAAPMESSDSMTEQDVAAMLATKIISYINNDPDAPIDNMYNQIKSWIAKVKKTIHLWEKDNQKNLNLQEVLSQLKDLLLIKILKLFLK